MLEQNPRRLVVFSRDEQKQEQMAQRFSHPSLRFFIGDVRDRQRLEMAMRDIEIVIHAAALKIVPILEYNPFEAIHTNVLGAENVIRASIAAGVKKVVAISTDKACHPVNLYGVTKLAAEKLFTVAHNLGGVNGPLYSVVRYGNVLGSRGSVVPLFQRIAAEGKPFPITDTHMTRFIITLDQAVEFVGSCIGRMQGAEIFVPKIPSVKITDIATAIDPELPYKVVGMRPGEKLHETLVTEDEGPMTEHVPGGWRIYPPRLTGNVAGWKVSSDNNEQWLSVEQLRAML